MRLFQARGRPPENGHRVQRTHWSLTAAGCRALPRGPAARRRRRRRPSWRRGAGGGGEPPLRREGGREGGLGRACASPPGPPSLLLPLPPHGRLVRGGWQRDLCARGVQRYKSLPARRAARTGQVLGRRGGRRRGRGQPPCGRAARTGLPASQRRWRLSAAYTRSWEGSSQDRRSKASARTVRA